MPYERYLRKQKEKEVDRALAGQPPWTEAQRARRMIAVDNRALQEVRYYQRGTNLLVPKAAMARYTPMSKEGRKPNVERMSQILKLFFTFVHADW